MKIDIEKLFIEKIEWRKNGEVVATTNSDAIFDFIRLYALNYGIKHKDNFNLFEYDLALYEENDLVELFKENTSGDLSVFDEFTNNRQLEPFINWIDQEGSERNSLGFSQQLDETKQK